MKSILYSNRNYGGAEIYVRMLKKTCSVDYQCIQGNGLRAYIKMLWLKEDLILHDVRAGFLALLRFSRKDIVIIHGPGFSVLIMNVFLVMSFFRNIEVLFANEDIMNRAWYKGEHWSVLSNISSINVESSLAGSDFIYVGRLTENKGVKALVDYWKESGRPEVLHIVGDGDLLQRLNTLDNNNIVFHGARDHNYIGNLIENSVKYYISFSKREGFSLSLIEALSAGLVPVVVEMPSQMFVSQNLGGFLIDRELSNIDYVIDNSKLNNKEIKEKVILWFTEYEKKSEFKTFWESKISLRLEK